MTTLRQAAQQVLEACTDAVMGWQSLAPLSVRSAAMESLDTLRDALAQEEQPKLAPAPGWCKHCRQYTVEEPLLAQQEQEPVAKYSDIVSDGGMDPRNKFDHPPRREWQGLTTQEAMALTDTAPKGVFYGCDAGTGLGIWVAAVAAAERALKEKNV